MSDIKQHTVYLTDAQWATIKTLDLVAPDITQADLLQGSDQAGWISVSEYQGERVIIDRQGVIQKRLPA